MNQNSGGVYVHVPFCVRKCSYCDFISYPASDNIQVMEAYLSSVVDELRLRKTELEQIRPITYAIYRGGGTPTCVPWQKLAPFVSTLIAEVEKINACGSNIWRLRFCGIWRRLWKLIAALWIPAGLPPSVRAELIAFLSRFQVLGCARVSFIGSACIRQKTVCVPMSGRVKRGLIMVSVDLILGAPGQTGQSFAQTLDAVISLGPAAPVCILSFG
jgi:hypothetical protein